MDAETLAVGGALQGDDVTVARGLFTVAAIPLDRPPPVDRRHRGQITHVRGPRRRRGLEGVGGGGRLAGVAGSVVGQHGEGVGGVGGA